ncbi:MAG: hypothetical protein J0I41_02805 [Filimonas sp.]|nr:hypothetical protein [Filimonas sp.]
MADIKDIFTEEHDHFEDDDLMKYLQDNLSEEEKHAFEKKMADSPFMNDAVEGLQEFQSNEKLQQYVSQLNKQLQQQLTSKKQQKEKRKIKDMSWILLAAIIILLLCILGYAVIYLYNKNKDQQAKPKQAGIAWQITIIDDKAGV